MTWGLAIAGILAALLYVGGYVTLWRFWQRAERELREVRGELQALRREHREVSRTAQEQLAESLRLSAELNRDRPEFQRGWPFEFQHGREE